MMCDEIGTWSEEIGRKEQPSTERRRGCPWVFRFRTANERPIPMYREQSPSSNSKVGMHHQLAGHGIVINAKIIGRNIHVVEIR